MEKEKPRAEKNETRLVEEFKKVTSEKPKKIIFLAVVLVAIILGTGTGYWLSRPGSLIKEEVKRDIGEEEIKAGVTVGVTDEKSFKDSAEGDLEKGGIDGEGSHHLVRPGGESQNVYLTSSIIDLEKFVSHKVKVWGQTFAAQKAGWLMDVGKLKVLE